MPEVEIHCPACGVKIRFRQGLPAGDWIHCPCCRTEFDLPEHRSGSSPVAEESAKPKPEPTLPSQQQTLAGSHSRESASPSSTGVWIGFGGAVVAIISLAIALFVVMQRNDGTVPSQDRVAENDQKEQTPPPEPDSQPSQPSLNLQPSQPPLDSQRLPETRPKDNGFSPVPQRTESIDPLSPSDPVFAEPSPAVNLSPERMPAVAEKQRPSEHASSVPPDPQVDVELPAIAEKPTPSTEQTAVADVLPADLHYEWKPGTEYAFQLSAEAEFKDHKEVVIGQYKYHVSDDLTGLPPIHEPEVSSGTGFVISSDGYIATCAHLVENNSSIEVDLAGRTYPATVLTLNHEKDLAILRIAAKGLPVVPLGDSSRVQLAQDIHMIGFPLTNVLGQSVKVTKGSIAGVIEEPSRKTFQVGPSIPQGSSGGPLVNDRGEVIGVANSQLDNKRVANASFAVPVQDLRTMAQIYNIRLDGSKSEVELDGPKLAKMVTPAVGLVRVTVGPIPGNDPLVLNYNGLLTYRQHTQRGYSRSTSISNYPGNSGRMAVDELGNYYPVGESDSIPFLKKLLARLPIAPLPSQPQATRNHHRIVMIQRDEVEDFSFGSIFPATTRSAFVPRTSVVRQKTINLQAEENISCRVMSVTGEAVVINREYELKTLKNATKMSFELSGRGTITFDRNDMLPRKIEHRLVLQVTDEFKTVRTPLTITLVRPTPEELAEQQRKLEEQKKRTAEITAQLKADMARRRAEENSPEKLLEHLKTIESAKKDNELLKISTTLSAIARMDPTDHTENQSDVLKMLKSLTNDKNSSVSRIARENYLRWADDQETDTVLTYLDDPSISIRSMAFAAAARIGGKKVIEEVASQFGRGDRYHAKKALIEIGRDAVPALAKWTEDSNRDIRLDAYRALGELGGDDAIMLLEQRVKDDPDILGQSTAKSALQRLRR